jgi:GNAT superfamily N-acetyltransferase
MIEFADGMTDTDAHVRIANEVWRWWNITAETLAHSRANIPGWKEWLAIVDGEPVGVGICGESPQHKDTEALGVAVLVLERARRHGVGTALYAVISDHARTLGKTELELFVEGDSPDGIDFVEKRGFRRTAENSSLRLPLDGLPTPQVAPPEGVTLATLAERPELARGVWEVATETLPDIPTDSTPYEAGPFERFRASVLAGPRFIPEATFVALHEGEPVGYAQLVWQDEDAKIAYHMMLGVKTSFRGRGIASALKAAQISWALENGLSELITDNELRNAPVRALNAHYAYQPVPSVLTYKGPVAAD